MITTDAACAYTVATGRLWCRREDFHRYAEQLLGRPIFTHEFARENLWSELRNRFEEQARLEDGRTC